MALVMTVWIASWIEDLPAPVGPTRGGRALDVDILGVDQVPVLEANPGQEVHGVIFREVRKAAILSKDARPAASHRGSRSILSGSWDGGPHHAASK